MLWPSTHVLADPSVALTTSSLSLLILQQTQNGHSHGAVRTKAGSTVTTRRCCGSSQREHRQQYHHDGSQKRRRDCRSDHRRPAPHNRTAELLGTHNRTAELLGTHSRTAELLESITVQQN